MERQPWQDPWRDLNFLRGKLTVRYCATPDEYENRAIETARWEEPIFTEADKIAARGMGVIL
jgi:hypothetical protein